MSDCIVSFNKCDMLIAISTGNTVTGFKPTACESDDMLLIEFFTIRCKNSNDRFFQLFYPGLFFYVI